jgi:alpha-N-acetylglucosamine transferase
MKKFLVILGVTILVIVLVIGCFYFYQWFNFRQLVVQQKDLAQQVDKKFEGLSEQQKNEALNTIDVGTTINKNIDKQEVKNIVVNSIIEANDKLIQFKMRTEITDAAKAYLALNENYGISGTDNVCQSFDLKNSISTMLRLSPIPASCAIGANFPLKTFTVTVPSPINSNKIYCTDQNGFAGLITNENLPFMSGVKCK